MINVSCILQNSVLRIPAIGNRISSVINTCVCYENGLKVGLGCFNRYQSTINLKLSKPLLCYIQCNSANSYPQMGGLVCKRFLSTSPVSQQNLGRESHSIRYVGIHSPISWLRMKFKLRQLRKWDPNFSLDEFVGGTKQAIGIITDLVAKGDFKRLEGLLTKEAIENLKTISSRWDYQTLQTFVVGSGSRLAAAPKQIVLRMSRDKRVCAIDVLFVTLKRASLVKQEDKTKLRAVLVEIMVRFFRDYSEGAPPEWTVMKLKFCHSNIGKTK